MVHTNKILTVSYGTFSCTLEGFEDSFDTMKAIAEYFRDLASDDRYFGAEPPQPDADMLARIAQRDVSRRVEAHSTDTGTIVLRAAEPEPVTVATAAVVVAETVTEVETETAIETVTETALEPEISPEVVEPEMAGIETFETGIVETDTIEPLGDEIEVAETPVVEIPDIGKANDVTDTDELSDEEIEIPQEVAEQQAEQQLEQPEIDAVPETEVEVFGEVEDTPEIAAEMPADVATEDAIEDTADDTAPDSTSDLAEDTTDDLELDDDPVVAPAPQKVAAVDSIAAKLQRIRAVVSQNDSLAQMDDYTEDQHADGFVTDAAQDISEALDIDDETLAAPQTDDTDDQISHILDQIDANSAPETDAEEDFFAATDQPEVEVEPVDEDVDDLVSDTLMSEPVSEPEADPVSDLDSAPLQARVVKVKRTDLEAAIASGQLEQMDGDDDTDEVDVFADQTPDQAPESSLSAEDEADLMRELAAVEQELAVDKDVFGEGADQLTDDAVDFDIEGAEAEISEAEENIFGDDILSEEPAHAALQQTVSEDEADLSRLMSEADEKLGDPETSSRHETYSQLRAAVAVAEAERSAGGAIDAETQDEAYRQDLAQVVRPRRPSADGARVAARPVVDSRPAPLKLVAEQRVDAGAEAASRGPVRPRRVMGNVGTPDSTGTDAAFAEFANRVGATELPDLLEAAAAYLSFVEGHEKFSRPQLMNKVRLIKQDGYNREDGLRSFGQLLRDGKIEKKGGGRFAASGDIGFRPNDAREAEAG